MGREDVLADRIATLRQSSSPPMSYEALASRMATVGCPIQPSALQRVEKGSPRRKVTVDELVALSQVFDVSIEDLIALPSTDLGHQAEAALLAYRQVLVSWRSASERLAASVVAEERSAKNVEAQRKALTGFLNRLHEFVHVPEAARDISPEQASALALLRLEIDHALNFRAPRSESATAAASTGDK